MTENDNDETGKRKAGKTQRLVTVFGGSGFLGQEIVRRLLDRGFAVRVAVRHPAAVDNSNGQLETVRADVRDEDTVAAALEGADAAIDSVGLYVERGSATFEAVHAQGARTVARQAARAGLESLVLISGIGVDAQSRSPYLRSRARGEALAREAFPEVTILRPSVLFGPGDAMVSALARVGRWAPVLPLFGQGRTKLQPVYRGDVAEAAVRAIETADARGRIYELGGPAVYSYQALVEQILRALGARRLLLPVPFALWDLQACVLGALPNPPLTRDQVALMQDDNVVTPQALTLADLGITPTPLETVLPEILGQRR